MADRYWVGGTANWDSTAGTKWAATSGGTGGASVPTSSDDVYFDANSGTGVVTISGGNCRSLNTTGFTGTLSGSASFNVGIYGGSLTLASENTYTALTQFSMYGTGAARTVSLGGKSVRMLSASGSGTLQVVGSFNAASCYFSSGVTVDTNGNSVTILGPLQVTGASTLNLSSSTLTLSSQGSTSPSSYIVYATNDSVIQSSSTAKILLTGGTTAQKQLQFPFGSNFQGSVELSGTGDCVYNLFGLASLGEIKYSKSSASTIKFSDLQTVSIKSWIVSGMPGALVSVTSFSGTNPMYLNYTGTGVVGADYLNISRVIATPSSTWYAGTHSVDSGGNSGWTFSDPMTASSIGFFACNF